MISKVAIGASAVLAIALFFMWRANANLSEDLGEARSSIRQAVLTNQENQQTIAQLRANLTTCVDQRRVDERVNRETIVQLERDLTELERQEREVRIVREEIFRDPSCNELAELDIGRSCPALADSLFGLAERLDTD